MLLKDVKLHKIQSFFTNLVWAADTDLRALNTHVTSVKPRVISSFLYMLNIICMLYSLDVIK